MESNTIEHNIKKFTIEGLFEDRNVEIPFDQNYVILIGVNGLGKTGCINYFPLFYVIDINLFYD